MKEESESNRKIIENGSNGNSDLKPAPLLISEIKDHVSPKISAGIIKSERIGNRNEFYVNKSVFTQFATFIYRAFDAKVELMHASDERQKHGNFRLYLIFSVMTDQFIIIYTDIPENDPKYVSCTPHVYAVNIYEREIMDTFGIIAEGHPDLRPFLLYDNWPAGKFPLRKDFGWNERVEKVETKFEFRRVDGDGVYEIPVGPVHAGIIEPGHFRFSVAGEEIINLEIRLGYMHKGTEKLSEQTAYDKGVLLSERISGDNSLSHAIAYCQAIEKCADANIPPRAKFLRTIYLELERVYNLCRDVAGISLVTSYNVGAANMYIAQERIMQLNDFITGNRFLRNVACIGGVKKDLSEKELNKIKEDLQLTKRDLDDFINLVGQLPSFLDRTQTTGIVSNEIANGMCIVGPVGRASGVERDVRKDHPYAAYSELDFKIITHTKGDVQARLEQKKKNSIKQLI